jgi:outer membrane protein assembly factor BamB
LTHRTFSRWSLTALVVLAALTLAGCGGQAPATAWPGLTPGDGVVYLTTTTKAYAIYAADGIQKWPYEHKVAQAGLFGSNMVSDQLHAKPALGDGVVYFGSDSGYLLAVDAVTGSEKWPYRPDLPTINLLVINIQEHPTPVYAGPAVAGKKVIFVGTGNQVYAVDAATGKPAQGWQPYDAGSRIWGTPLVVTDTVYVATLGHQLIALDLATGKPRWTFDKPTGALAGAPVFDNGVVYVGSFDKRLYAVDAASGQERWSFNANNWVWEGPVVVSNTLYFGDLGGNVYALDAKTQNPKWKQPFQAEGAVRATPLYADGKLYVGTDKGALYELDATTGQPALDATTGQPRWPQPFKVPNARFLTTPLMQGGLLLVAPLQVSTLLYGLDPSNGQTRWQFTPPK